MIAALRMNIETVTTTTLLPLYIRVAAENRAGYVGLAADGLVESTAWAVSTRSRGLLTYRKQQVLLKITLYSNEKNISRK